MWAAAVAGLLLFAGSFALVLHGNRRYVRQDREAPTMLLPLPWAVPGGPLTVAEAHQLMQAHRLCLADECPCKAAAWRTLVEAGRIRPDTGRAY